MKKHNAIAIIMSTALCISASNSYAKSYTYSLKNYRDPSRGCIPVSRISLQEAEDVLESQNLGISGATNAETRTAGAAITWLQHLNGDRPLSTGKWKGRNPYKFVVKSGSGNSAQRASYILIRRNGNKEYGLSVAQYVHEYAHFIGNNGGYGQYRSYMKRKGAGYCMVSNYADNNSHEQFAEVLAAFATDPEVLTKNNRTPRNCKHAFNFFKSWFNKGSRVKKCL